MAFSITIESDASANDLKVVNDGLDEYNLKHSEEFNHQTLNIFARDEGGQIVAGLLGDTFWKWLHINILWVREDLRHAGLGRELLAAAEMEARKRACRAAQLETHTFQALPFYQKNGYIVFGELADFPSGFTKYYLKKDLV